MVRLECDGGLRNGGRGREKGDDEISDKVGDLSGTVGVATQFTFSFFPIIF